MAGSGDVAMRYSSSPGLSSPLSDPLSEPPSPAGDSHRHKPNEGDEIIVDASSIRFDPSGQPILTKDGVPRRKPGPKPGTRVRKSNADGSSSATSDVNKVKRPRKPRDPNAPPVQRKRKITSLNEEPPTETKPLPATAAVNRQPKITDMTSFGRLEPMAPRVPKREPFPGSMQSILNAEPSPEPEVQALPSAPPSVPPRSSGTNYDPIRSNYDPVRETMVTHSFSSSMGSPRAPTHVTNRASASPSIASLVDPPVPSVISPSASHTTFAAPQRANVQETNSLPASPNPFRKDFVAPPAPTPKPAASATPTPAESKKPTPAPSVAASLSSKFDKIEIRPSSITTIGAGASATASKKASKHNSTTSSPRSNAVRDVLMPPVPGANDRSILDFGKAEPGSELQAPSIILEISLNGESNKYVNFMREAEQKYGWDALHPRQAANRERKARIAAASAALEKEAKESGDEMSVDESDADNSNVEMGGTSGAEKPGEGAPVKKKKRHFKEDEYDREDDFVDDSEMLWEQQAAASQDGFFVYSGPLVPEVEKVERNDGPPKRGRGSRGGRGGARGAGTGTTRAAGTGRGGGPGSRGGVVRKPRMTKADKAQLDREKADREKLAQMTSKSTNGTPASNGRLSVGGPLEAATNALSGRDSLGSAASPPTAARSLSSGNGHNILNPTSSPPFAGLA